jgi:hypothetical protein
MGTTPVNSSPDPTSLASAQANVLASFQAMAANLNQNLVTIYNGQFSAFAISVQAGRIPNTNPPAVPASWVVTVGADGWPVMTQSGPPVCAALPVPPDPNQQPGTPGTLKPMTFDIEANLGGGWFAAGPLDTWPAGKLTPPTSAPDGTTGAFLKVAAPVGTTYITDPATGIVMCHGGWYELQLAVSVQSK